MNAPGPTTVYLSEYTPSEFAIKHTRLVFRLGFDETLVQASHLVQRIRESSGILCLNLGALEVLSIGIDGTELSGDEYEIGEDHLVLKDVPERFRLDITNRIHPEQNTALEGLYRSGNMLCTQCEAEGFRKITPSIDRPDSLTRYSVRMEAPKQEFPVLLSNGNLIDRGELDAGWHYAEWQDPFPKPTYLFALVAGPLDCLEDHFTTMSGRDVTLRFFVQDGEVEKCAHAMASLKQAMAWDERAWGREYDLDLYNVVAVRDFNMGAMENKSLNIFNTTYVLADESIATDYNFQLVRDIIGHEYFHNWSGNRVTLRDWFQLSLKEGFTVFREQEFSADMTSPGVRRIEAVDCLRNNQFAEDAGAMAHPVQPHSYQQIDNFYTATVYEKGAEVVRMLQTLVGRDTFRRGTDLYFEIHDGKAVTVDEFVGAIETVSGLDLSQFRLWYSQAGTPVLEARFRYLPSESALELTLGQHCPVTADGSDKKPFMIPVATALFSEEGEKIDIGTDGNDTVLILKSPKQTFRFENIPCPAIPSLLRGFSAPVELDADLSGRQLALLLHHDDDPFVRWDAGQQLFLNQLLDDIASIRQGDDPAPSRFLCDLVKGLVTDRSTDHELLATLISLPAADYLNCRLDVIDPIAIHKARRGMKGNLAIHCRDAITERYRECARISTGQAVPDEMAARTLRDRCLDYLGELDDPAAWKIITEQLAAARCMTDSIGALAVLAGSRHPEKSTLIDGFYEKWKHQPEVVDKWLAIQAGAPLPSTLERVRALTRHPGFNWKNPNNVRALIGRFCARNPAAFHAEDGSGYDFAMEWIRKLDPVNSSLGSSIARSFENWRRYRPDLANRMHGVLLDLKEIRGLSSNTREIVTNSLKD
ncbi:MAG: aminopeptidase N [Gammaproteobacteria bacterium]|nr:aminopeptidase N [Gammaproteobacteria bacterium]